MTIFALLDPTWRQQTTNASETNKYIQTYNHKKIQKYKITKVQTYNNTIIQKYKNIKMKVEKEKNTREGGKGPVLKYNRLVDRSRERGSKKREKIKVLT